MIRGPRRYHVVIRFSPKVAGNVEEVLWHPTQQCTPLEDGSLRYEVDVDGVEEISWWVLGYGKEAVVEKPAALRKIIVEHFQAMAGNYAHS
jgi:predicted DNA-binding transcriptional regulator YafY